MNTVERRATWLLAAIRDDDHEAAGDLLAATSPEILRDLCRHLAAQVPPPTFELDDGGDILSHAALLVAVRFGVRVEDVLGSSRRREACDARAATCYALYLMGMSYASMGRQLGRDHTTVMSAVSRAGERSRLRKVGTEVATRLGWVREVA